MTHKLPELFENIVKFDNAKPYRYETSHEEIKRRNELTAAAAQYVKRQRGSGGSGASG